MYLKHNKKILQKIKETTRKKKQNSPEHVQHTHTHTRTIYSGSKVYSHKIPVKEGKINESACFCSFIFDFLIILFH